MTVTRPASSAFATREATQGLAALLPIGPEAKARIRVLVVDDEHTLRETCATVLQLNGYDVTAVGREEALALLRTHPWRGNVRELQNVIEHTAVVVEPGGEIQPADIPLTGDARTALSANPASLVATLREESYHAARERVIRQFEKQYLTWLVSRAGGNMSKAARIAGVDRTTLYRLMERHTLQRNPGPAWLVECEAEAPGAADQPALPPEGRASAATAGHP